MWVILNDFVSNLMLHQKMLKELQGIYEDQMQISSLIVSDCPSLDKISKVEIDFCCNCHESQKRWQSCPQLINAKGGFENKGKHNGNMKRVLFSQCRFPASENQFGQFHGFPAISVTRLLFMGWGPILSFPRWWKKKQP